MKYIHKINQNIYITSNEEIKDIRPYKCKWQLEQGQILNKFPIYLTDISECKLVIMTTDQDLIKDGVQAIDDEFLEWFVKNPSCEWVETYSLGVQNGETGESCHYKYEIIIPKEEPYKGTLSGFEEGPNAHSDFLEQNSNQTKQKRMYSEEEVLQIIKNAFNQGERYGWDTQFSIGNIDEMKSKIPFISLEKYLETFNK